MLIISNLAFLTMSKKVHIWYLTFSATYSPKSSSRRKSFWFYSRRREGIHANHCGIIAVPACPPFWRPRPLMACISEHVSICTASVEGFIYVVFIFVDLSDYRLFYQSTLRIIHTIIADDE